MRVKWSSCSYSVDIMIFFSSRRRHTRSDRDWSSDVCSSDLTLPGKLIAVNGEATVALDIGGEIRARAPSVPIAAGDRVTVCMRPEHLRLADDGEGLAGIVEMGLPLGPSIVHEVRTADGRGIKVTEPRAAGAQPRRPGRAGRGRTVRAGRDSA